MILAQFFGLSLAGAAHSTRVASIGNKHEIGSDEADIGGASSMRILLIIGPIFLVLHFGLDGHDLLLALRRKHQLVHLEKCLLQGQLIILILEIFVALQFLHEMPLHEGGDLCACIVAALPPWPSKMAKR